MSTVVKDLGAATAYGYAVEKGYTGTEAEFAELMASYATVGQTAVNAAQTATTKASEAATSAIIATNKASEATTAATTATNKAAEAQADADAAALDASQALSAASTATSKATEATTAAATAVSAKDDAVSANTAAQSAKTAAQTAQTGAETAAASVSASAAQIQTNADDISELKEDINGIHNIELTLSNYHVKSADGSLEENAGYRCSQLIPVKQGEKYAYSVYASTRVLSVALYADSLSNALLPPISIKGITSLDTGIITIPYGINYIRVSCSNAQISDLYLKQIYTALDDVTLELAKLTTKTDVIDVTLWNMCNEDNIETLEHTFINGTTITTGQANYFSMRYFPVDANAYYQCSSGEGVNPPRFVNFYDSSKGYLSNVGNAKAFTTPNNCAYVSVTFYYKTPSTTNPVKSDDYYLKKAEMPFVNVISFDGNEMSTNDIYDFVPEINASRKLGFAEHRCAVINFQFDDGNAKDANIVSIFKDRNAVCGFALISDIAVPRVGEYLGYQNDGFEILSHSTDTTGMNDATVDPSTIAAKLKNSKKVLMGYGFNVRGFVTPDSTMYTGFIPLLHKYYDFAYTVYFGGYNGTGTPYFDKTAEMNKLSRVSVQNTTLDNMKLAVDNAIANSGFLTFYGHSAQLDTTDYETTENLESLLDYINTKQADLQCKLLAPSDAVDFYFHVRHSDYLELLNV